MATVRKTISEIRDPIRRNDLEARRRKLGLSRVALGRILEVDPATVFRRERGPLSALWDYALRGIEAEAAVKSSKVVIQSYESRLDRASFIPDQLSAKGYAYLAEKMNEARRQHPRKKSPRARRKSAPAQPPTLQNRYPRALTQDEIRAADRAEERSRKQVKVADSRGTRKAGEA